MPNQNNKTVDSDKDEEDISCDQPPSSVSNREQPSSSVSNRTTSELETERRVTFAAAQAAFEERIRKKLMPSKKQQTSSNTSATTVRSSELEKIAPAAAHAAFEERIRKKLMPSKKQQKSSSTSASPPQTTTDEPHDAIATSETNQHSGAQPSADIEQIDDNDGPEPPVATLEESLNTADTDIANKTSAAISNNLESINQLSPPVPFNAQFQAATANIPDNKTDLINQLAPPTPFHPHNVPDTKTLADREVTINQLSPPVPFNYAQFQAATDNIPDNKSDLINQLAPPTPFHPHDVPDNKVVNINQLSPPVPFNFTEFEGGEEDDDIKMNAKERMNQMPLAVSNNDNEDESNHTTHDVPGPHRQNVGTYPPTSAARPEEEQSEMINPPPPVSGNHNQVPDIIRRPPPPSMLLDPFRVSDPSNVTSEQVLETAAVENVAVGVVDASVEQDETNILEAYAVDDDIYGATPLEPTLPWWKQRRTKILLGSVLVIVSSLAIALGVLLSQSSDPEQVLTNSTVTLFVTPPPTISIAPSLSIAPSTSPPTITYECFDADDGGEDGILYNAVRSYVDQLCAVNKICPIAQVYGWPINSWCVGNVKDMSYLLYYAENFNEDISNWNTSSVTDMSWMFAGASSFNSDLFWDTSSVTNMESMFDGASLFNGDVSNFDTSSVTDMGWMFYNAWAFNGDVSNFNTSSVTRMYSMFESAGSFSQDLSNFDTSSVTDMESMFSYASSFNGDISNFNTSRVSDMGNMFSSATAFNQDLSNFDTSSVTLMNGMFQCAGSFDQDLSNFNTSKVTNMGGMFWGAVLFNQDLSNFNITSGTDMWRMFEGATAFNQDLCSWQDSFPYTYASNIFTDSNCTYQDTPNETQKGPFCSSSCGSSLFVSHTISSSSLFVCLLDINLSA